MASSRLPALNYAAEYSSAYSSSSDAVDQQCPYRVEYNYTFPPLFFVNLMMVDEGAHKPNDKKHQRDHGAAAHAMPHAPR